MHKNNRLIFQVEGSLELLDEYEIKTKDGSINIVNMVLKTSSHEDVVVNVRSLPHLTFLKTLKLGTLLRIQGDLRTKTNKDGESELTFTLNDGNNSVVKVIEAIDIDHVIAKGNLDIIHVEKQDNDYRFTMQYHFPGGNGMAESRKYIYNVQITEGYTQVDSLFLKRVNSEEFKLFQEKNISIQMAKMVLLSAKVQVKSNLLVITSKVGWIFSPHIRMEKINEEI